MSKTYVVLLGAGRSDSPSLMRALDERAVVCDRPEWPFFELFFWPYWARPILGEHGWVDEGDAGSVADALLEGTNLENASVFYRELTPNEIAKKLREERVPPPPRNLFPSGNIGSYRGKLAVATVVEWKPLRNLVEEWLEERAWKAVSRAVAASPRLLSEEVGPCGEGDLDDWLERNAERFAREARRERQYARVSGDLSKLLKPRLAGVGLSIRDLLRNCGYGLDRADLEEFLKHLKLLSKEQEIEDD